MGATQTKGECKSKPVKKLGRAKAARMQVVPATHHTHTHIGRVHTFITHIGRVQMFITHIGRVQIFITHIGKVQT